MEEKGYIFERLEILEKSGLITRQAVVQTEKMLELLEAKGRDPDPEKLVMFTTHMAMALGRIGNGQQEEPMDRAVLEDIKEESAYAEAQAFMEELKKIMDTELPESEEEYMIVHLCNLFS